MSCTVEVKKKWWCKIPRNSEWESQWSSPIHKCLRDPNVECYLSVKISKCKRETRKNEQRSYVATVQNIKVQLMFTDRISESVFNIYYTILVQDDDYKNLGLFLDHQNISRRSLNGKEHLIELQTSQIIKNDALKFTVIIKFDLDSHAKLIQNPVNSSEQNVGILSNQFSANLGSLLNNKKYSDVVLRTKEGRMIPAHKCLLAAQSSIFAAMFRDSVKENQDKFIPVGDADLNTLKAVLQFIYTGKFESSVHGKFEILAFASCYNIIILRDLCEIEMSNKVNIVNATTALVVADKHNLKLLKEKSCKFLAVFMKINPSSEILRKLRFEHPSLFEDILNLVMSGDNLE